MKVHVRTSVGAEADWAFVKELGRRCVASSVGPLRSVAEPIARAAFDRLCEIVDEQSHLTLIAEREGARVGFALILDDLPDEVTSLPQAFVAYMAVDPQFRHNGVATALLAAAEDEARRLGLQYMALMVTEANEAARRLYERDGYLTERRLLCKPL